jgi:hypothetical protein
VVSIPFLFRIVESNRGKVLGDFVIGNLFGELSEVQLNNGNAFDRVVKCTATLSPEGNLLLAVLDKRH